MEKSPADTKRRLHQLYQRGQRHASRMHAHCQCVSHTKDTHRTRHCRRAVAERLERLSCASSVPLPPCTLAIRVRARSACAAPMKPAWRHLSRIRRFQGIRSAREQTPWAVSRPAWSGGWARAFTHTRSSGHRQSQLRNRISIRWSAGPFAKSAQQVGAFQTRPH